MSSSPADGHVRHVVVRIVTRRAALLAIGVAVALVAAVGLSVVLRADGESGAPPWLACTTASVGQPRYAEREAPAPQIALSRVLDLEDPTDLAFRAGGDTFYVAVRVGVVYRVDPGTDPVPVLDISPLPLTGQGGLMSITFDPDGRWLYLSYTVEDPDLVNYVRAYRVADDGSVDPAPSTILAVPQPVDLHNLGELVFGSDGYLYVSIGDGGSPELEPDIRRDGQNLSTIYGGILRIDPQPEVGGYLVPDDNPFFDVEGAKPELWVFGLREPWRFSFDRSTGDLWVGDVGQYCFEEISHVAAADAAGTNFGWSGLEGYHEAVDEVPEEHLLPVHAYPRTPADDDGITRCAVIGGHVYRGAAIPELRGEYVFADWCAAQVQMLTLRADGAVEITPLVTQQAKIQSFAESPTGELYVIDTNGVSLVTGG